MAKSKLELLLEVEGANQAKRALDSVTGGLDNMSRKQKDLSDASSLAGRGLDMLGAAAAGMFAALSVREIAGAAVEMYNLSAAAAAAEVSLNAITGGGAAEYIYAISRASDGTISRLDAMAAANRALQLGVVQSADDMAKLTETARTLGRVMGMETSAAMNDLVTGIGRLSPMILDNLGLTVKMSEVNAEAARLMEQNAGMTEAQAQKLALLNQAAAQAAQIQAGMGDAARTAADNMEWFAARIEDAKIALGDYIREGVSPAISAWREAAELQGRLAAETGLLVDDFDEFNNIMRENTQGAQLMTKWFGLKGAAARELGAIIDLVVNPALFFMSEEINRNTFEMIQQAKAANHLNDRYEDLHVEARLFRQAQEAARDSTEEVSAAMEEEVSEAEALAQAYVDGLITLEEYEAGKREMMTVTERAAAKARDEAAALKELERAAKAAFDRQKSLAGIAEDLTGRYNYLGQTYTTIIGQDQQMVDLAAALTKERERLAEQIFREEFAWQVVGGDAEEYSKTMEKLTGNLAALDAQLAAANERIGGQEQSYRITQLAAEDLKSVGEGLLALWGESTNEIKLQGAAYDQLRLKYGLVTQEQLNMERGLNAIVEAMDRNILSVSMISRIYDDWVTGAIPNTETLNERIADSEERYRGVLTKLDETGLAAGTAAEESENAADRMNRSFDSASTAAGNINWQLAHIETKLTRMTGQPWDIRLRISGSIPDIPSVVGAGGVEMRAAGGPVTAGRAYVVGEKGPELFVPNRSGTIVPQNALASGGGQTIMPIYIGDRLLDEIVIDGWVRGVRRRGGDVSAITRGAIRA